MKDKLTLVVMAAGMGSRFGGLKQITPVDDDANFLIDYSLYDAIKAEFSKVVFIIKEENLQDFRDTIGKRIEQKIDVAYVFQKLTDVPSFVTLPKDRVKPWGTVQAVLAAKEEIDGAFAVINADDFYGASSYQIVAEALRKSKDVNEQIAIPYPFCNVSSKHGFVKRGVLFYKGDNVSKILECSVGYEDDKVVAKPLDGSEPFEIAKDHPVSMNMFGFKKEILAYLEEYFVNFMAKNQNDLANVEALLPVFLEEYLESGKITLKYVLSDGVWLGMTYKEDLEEVKEKIAELKEKKEYPRQLWEG